MPSPITPRTSPRSGRPLGGNRPSRLVAVLAVAVVAAVPSLFTALLAVVLLQASR